MFCSKIPFTILTLRTPLQAPVVTSAAPVGYGIGPVTAAGYTSIGSFGGYGAWGGYGGYGGYGLGGLAYSGYGMYGRYF